MEFVVAVLAVLPGVNGAEVAGPATVADGGAPAVRSDGGEMAGGESDGCFLERFRLYETRSNFYLIGTDKSGTLWKVLKIDRQEPSELSIREDSTTYSDRECRDLLKRVHEGNRSTGGLRFLTNCYGIVGFVKFLGPYYMLIITKRRKIGAICGHTVYSIAKSNMIALPEPSPPLDMATSKMENRYKKLLCNVDLTRDFFFSYSYHIMRSLQKNLCDEQPGQTVYDTMFVWNEYLTRGIRNHVKNTLWTVALVYGFFKQDKLSVSGKEFKLTLIARRSRHYAGTRYLKRGVNEKGRVANDVETEQIVFEDTPGEHPSQISSVVQNRGSIPLFWSQETSRLNIKPDIILHRKDENFEATRLHFLNLKRRYGNPIIILNLIKTQEKRPRESILRAEFANAIDHINEELSEENHLRFLHWDLNKHSRSKASNVLVTLGRVASYALNLTGFFFCQVKPSLRIEGAMRWPVLEKDDGSHRSSENTNCNGRAENCEEIAALVKEPLFQNGVLRTNCIDCLDRTNVAQYSFGLAALGRQLHALGFAEEPKIELDEPLADDLMSFYETMGDTLALQYGGSAAHNKIFCERRGQWKAATQSQEFFRTLQRYYSNAYMDAEKQDAINVFLGHFQPQLGKPALWELDSDQYYGIGRRGFSEENSRSFVKRSFSDGNILCESQTPITNADRGKKSILSSLMPERNSTPAISCATDVGFSRKLFNSAENYTDASNCSNFLDLDCLSSSGNSCEEELCDRFSLIGSPAENNSDEYAASAASGEEGSDAKALQGPSSDAVQLPFGSAGKLAQASEFPESFVKWVSSGEALCH
ncbi:phosphoinositide phosphatase SAC2-like [Wolffia australiana]